jgi:hypothetical protein
MRDIMNLAIAKDQCRASTSDDEFNTVLDTFMGVFAATKCWESLCNSPDAINELLIQSMYEDAANELLIRTMFEDAANCAGVELDMHECVYDHIIEIFTTTNVPIVHRLRRVLQQQPVMVDETNPCYVPSEEELNIVVSTMLNGAKDKCIASGFDLESSTIASDLATIFSSPTCWGVSGCQDEESSEEPVVVSASMVEGGVRSIHLPSTTTTTTVSTDDTDEDVPVMDDPTIDAKHDNVIGGDKAKVHNAVFIVVAAGGLVAIAALVVGLRRSRRQKENVIIAVDEKSTDGSSDGQSSAGDQTAEISLSMTSV